MADKELKQDEGTQDPRDIKIAAMEEQMNRMAALIEQLTASSAATTAVPVVTAPAAAPSVVKIIHLVQRAPRLNTRMQIGNTVIIMTSIGEERTLTLQQFEELVGKYRGWFTEGIIAVHKDYEQYAQHYGLPVMKKIPVKSDLISRLGTMSMGELEDLFPRVPQAVQDSILGYWNREVLKGNPAFKDIRKLETLNRLSDGALSQLASELIEESKKPKK